MILELTLTVFSPSKTENNGTQLQSASEFSGTFEKRTNNGKEETGFIGEFDQGIPRWQVIIEADMPANLTVSSHTTNYNYPALIFGILLIIIIICGNVLVCLSVYTEKALKTTTNYFIVSLAVADLLLAVLVLPLFVYAEVSYETSLPRYLINRYNMYYNIYNV